MSRELVRALSCLLSSNWTQFQDCLAFSEAAEGDLEKSALVWGRSSSVDPMPSPLSDADADFRCGYLKPNAVADSCS